jgi:hypoxanthine phosphoribosyltransferase
MGKKILVIDDINDTGATFRYIEEKFGRPERLRFAALVDNIPSEIRVNYKGYTIDKSKDPAWIVFPWEDWEK